MINMSINQLLSLWGELARAYFGQNSFGGDTAEVYAYSLMPYEPLVANAKYMNPKSEFAKDVSDCYKGANRSFIAVLAKFQKDFNCRVEIEGVKLEDWPMDDEFQHRYHVKVIPL